MITTVGIFAAREGDGERLRPLLEEHLAQTLAEPGCLGGQVALGVDDPNRLLLVTQWQSRAAHEAVECEMGSDAGVHDRFAAMMELLAGPPVYARFVTVADGLPTEDASEGIPHCRQCGMPLGSPAEYAGGGTETYLCIHCAPNEGTLAQAMGLAQTIPGE